jgi:hypothetical protein
LTRIYNKLIDGDGCGQSSQFHVAMACLEDLACCAKNNQKVLIIR